MTSKRKVGRPKLPSRTQLTTKIERRTLKMLKTEARRRLRPGKKRIEIGRVIDELVERCLS